MILKKVKNEIGATAIEYGLIASLVAVVAVSGMSAVGVNLSNTYCTISQHLGGSGTCSGATSSGSSGTGSGGSTSGTGGTTGSPDLDNLTGSAYLNALESHLVDYFDPKYLDKSLGGQGNLNIATSLVGSETALSLMTDYNQKNPNDPITHVFGLYNAFTKEPITSWSEASEYLKDQNNGLNTTVVSNQHMYSLEATTQSGHVYNINTINNHASGSMTIYPSNVS